MLRLNRVESPRRPRTRRAAALALALGGALASGWWLAPGPVAVRGEGASPPGVVDVLAAGDLRGEIHPCGCSPEVQWGGLPRRLTFLQQALDSAPENPPIVVDLGNNFPEPTDQGKLKIELIQDLLKQVPPAAILPGPNELAVGLESLDRGLPYLLSNDALGKAFLPDVTIERRGTRIGIYGFLSPAAVYQEFAGQYRLLPADAGWIARTRARIRAAGHARTILLFRGGDAELEALHRAGLFDRIIVGNPFSDELNQVVTRSVAGVTFPQVATKGQAFYRLPLRLDGASPAALPEPVYLKENFADHPVAVHAFANYDEKVKDLFFARLGTMERSQSESPFVGAAVCVVCHAREGEIWSASRHSRALATLERVKKNFDTECLVCHVAGLGRDGFLSQDLTPHLGNVQCENCHGPGRAHAADPANVKPRRIAEAIAAHGSPESVCRTCHHGSHSPSFAYPKYWPKIAHGKP